MSITVLNYDQLCLIYGINVIGDILWFPTTAFLIGIEHITTFSAQPAVLYLQPDPERPSRCNTCRCKRSIAAHRNNILWTITLRIQVRSVDETSHRHHVDNGE